MCVIVYKPQGNKLPSMKDLKACFEANPHGAGLMWAETGSVHIRKGFMTWEAFKTALAQRAKWDDVPLVIHFRITTQGGVKPGLTHPFAVCGSYDGMAALSVSCEMGIAHNGIIATTSDGAKDHNDTMRFIRDFAYPVMKIHRYADSDGVLAKGLGDICSGSRLAIMHGDGQIDLTGHWEKRKDGCSYSNLNAFPNEASKMYARRRYWDDWGGCDC